MISKIKTHKQNLNNKEPSITNQQPQTLLPPAASYPLPQGKIHFVQPKIRNTAKKQLWNSWKMPGIPLSTLALRRFQTVPELLSSYPSPYPVFFPHPIFFLFTLSFSTTLPDTILISDGALPCSARETTIFMAHRTISLISTS